MNETGVLRGSELSDFSSPLLHPNPKHHFFAQDKIAEEGCARRGRRETDLPPPRWPWPPSGARNRYTTSEGYTRERENEEGRAEKRHLLLLRSVG